MYLHEIASGVCARDGAPKILAERAATCIRMTWKFDLDFYNWSVFVSDRRRAKQKKTFLVM
jgi:hypothetical protein